MSFENEMFAHKTTDRSLSVMCESLLEADSAELETHRELFV